jgi:hypothetical protein
MSLIKIRKRELDYVKKKTAYLRYTVFQFITQ